MKIAKWSDHAAPEGAAEPVNKHLYEDMRKAIQGINEAIKAMRQRITHCVTKLRCDIVDRHAISEPRLRAHPAVLGIIDGETYQIILCPAVVAATCQALEQLTDGLFKSDVRAAT